MTKDEAIRILDPETTAEALVEYEYYGGFNGKTAMVNAVSDACEVAVAALREQKADNKLNRSRWEGCFLCKDATCLYGDVCVSGTHYVGISEFDFCPNCGRPLTEEAWAELERKIGGTQCM